jgi:hypothetical protein
MKPAGRGEGGITTSRSSSVSYQELRDQALIECPITPWRGQSLEGQEMSNFAMEARKPHGHQGRTGTQAQASDQKNKPHVVLLPMTETQLDAQVRRIKSEPGAVHTIPSPITQNSPAPCSLMEQTRNGPVARLVSGARAALPYGWKNPIQRAVQNIPCAQSEIITFCVDGTSFESGSVQRFLERVRSIWVIWIFAALRATLSPLGGRGPGR